MTTSKSTSTPLSHDQLRRLREQLSRKLIPAEHLSFAACVLGRKFDDFGELTHDEARKVLRASEHYNRC